MLFTVRDNPKSLFHSLCVHSELHRAPSPKMEEVRCCGTCGFCCLLLSCCCCAQHGLDLNQLGLSGNGQPKAWGSAWTQYHWVVQKWPPCCRKLSWTDVIWWTTGLGIRERFWAHFICWYYCPLCVSLFDEYLHPSFSKSQRGYSNTKAQPEIRVVI